MNAKTICVLNSERHLESRLWRTVVRGGMPYGVYSCNVSVFSASGSVRPAVHDRITGTAASSVVILFGDDTPWHGEIAGHLKNHGLAVHVGHREGTVYSRTLRMTRDGAVTHGEYLATQIIDARQREHEDVARHRVLRTMVYMVEDVLPCAIGMLGRHRPIGGEP